MGGGSGSGSEGLNDLFALCSEAFIHLLIYLYKLNRAFHKNCDILESTVKGIINITVLLSLVLQK